MATFKVLWIDQAWTQQTDTVDADSMEVSCPESAEPLLELRKEGEVIAAYVRTNGGIGWVRCQKVTP